jgi:glutaredoxin 3
VKIVEIEDLPDMDAIQDYCKKLTGARSVPRVWIDKKFIGGGDDVEKAFKNGTLQKLV